VNAQNLTTLLVRGVAALVLVAGLAVVGAYGADTTAVNDRSPGMSTKAASSTASTAVAAGSSSQGGGLPQGSEPVKLDPADFSINIDNPYWPMSPGSK
jgi:hypothetical protein